MFIKIDVDVKADAHLRREDGSFLILTAKEMEQIYYAWNSCLIQCCKDEGNYNTVNQILLTVPSPRNSKKHREEIPE